MNRNFNKYSSTGKWRTGPKARARMARLKQDRRNASRTKYGLLYSDSGLVVICMVVLFGIVFLVLLS